jgi:thioesterase domain-containing protein/acyl carrier protein
MALKFPLDLDRMSNDAIEPTSSISPTIGVLMAIWQSVLQRYHVEIDDNFFDCGGDSLAAVSLFSEIKKVTGKDLPITTIYDAPTIAELGALLDATSAVRFSPLVLAKPGSGAPPFFLIHGGGGTVMLLVELGKLIKYEGPVYAIQARGLDGIEPPSNCIDEMVVYYLKALSEIQSQGPYLLAGHSAGGLIALEMARRLTGAGQKVALLGFLDSYPAPDAWPLIMRLGIRYRRGVQHRLRRLLKAPLSVQLAYIRYRWRRAGTAANRGLVSPLDQWDPPISLPPAIQAVGHGAMEAVANYRPRFYAGKITYFRATKAAAVFPMARNPRAVWRRYAAEIEIHSVPGDHFTIVEAPFAAELANVLSRCINAALQK